MYADNATESDDSPDVLSSQVADSDDEGQTDNTCSFREVFHDFEEVHPKVDVAPKISKGFADNLGVAILCGIAAGQVLYDYLLSFSRNQVKGILKDGFPLDYCARLLLGMQEAYLPSLAFNSLDPDQKELRLPYAEHISESEGRLLRGAYFSILSLIITELRKRDLILLEKKLFCGQAKVAEDSTRRKHFKLLRFLAAAAGSLGQNLLIKGFMAANKETRRTVLQTAIPKRYLMHLDDYFYDESSPSRFLPDRLKLEWEGHVLGAKWMAQVITAFHELNLGEKSVRFLSFLPSLSVDVLNGIDLVVLDTKTKKLLAFQGKWNRLKAPIRCISSTERDTVFADSSFPRERKKKKFTDEAKLLQRAERDQKRDVLRNRLNQKKFEKFLTDFPKFKKDVGSDFLTEGYFILGSGRSLDLCDPVLLWELRTLFT